MPPLPTATSRNKHLASCVGAKGADMYKITPFVVISKMSEIKNHI